MSRRTSSTPSPVEWTICRFRATGLSKGIEQREGKWFADSPMGQVEVEMAPANSFGVLDHDVTLPNGVNVHNAFRVTPCAKGSLLPLSSFDWPASARRALTQMSRMYVETSRR